MKKISKEKVSEAVGFSTAYLSVMKHKNPKAYDWLLSFDKAPIKSIRMAKKETEAKRDEVQDMIYELEVNRTTLKFGKFLKEIGHYKKSNSIYAFVNRSFKPVDSSYYASFQLDTKILEFFERFKNND